MEKPLCLVTGACGFIGSHMVEVLLDAGYPVRVTDLPEAFAQEDKRAGRFPSVLKDRKVEIIEADLTQGTTLARVTEGVKWVFHVAGLFRFSASRDALQKVNVKGTKHLLDSLLSQRQVERFVHWSDAGIYGLNTQGKLPFTEDVPAEPSNEYGRSKVLAEELVLEVCAKHGTPHAVLRPTAVYGPRAVYGTGILVMGLARLNPLMAPVNLNARVPMVHVRDVCLAARHLAELETLSSGIYNVNDDSQMTQLDLMQFFARLMGHAFIKLPPVPLKLIRKGLSKIAYAVQTVTQDWLHFPNPLEADPVAFLNRDFAFSNQKLKSTGYTFLYPDPRIGLKETVQWYQAQGWLS